MARQRDGRTRASSSRRSGRPTTATRASSRSARTRAGARSSSRASPPMRCACSTSRRGTAAVVDRARASAARAHGRRHRPEPGDARRRPRARRPRRARIADRAARGTRRSAAVRRRRVRRADVHVSPPLRRRSRRDAARARARRAARAARSRCRSSACRAACGGRCGSSTCASGCRSRARVVSPGWHEVGSFLGPSIRGFYERLPLDALLDLWRDAGIADVQRAADERRRRHRRLGHARVSDAARPAFYALRPGGWRDYVTLLHPPYTLWHLSYVAVGAALAPHMNWALLGWTTLAFSPRDGRRRARARRAAGPPAADADPDARARRARRRRRSVPRARSAASIAVRDDALAARLRRRSAAFIVVAYNLELFGGAFHTDALVRGRVGRVPRAHGVLRLRGADPRRGRRGGRVRLPRELAQRRLSTRCAACGAQPRRAPPGAERLLRRSRRRALRLLAAAMPVLAGALLLGRVG